LAISWEVTYCIDDDPYERGPVVVLMHLALIPGSETATGCAGVLLPAPSLSVVSFLEQVLCRTFSRVSLTLTWRPDGPPCILGSTSITLLRGRTYLGSFLIACLSGALEPMTGVLFSVWQLRTASVV
jgi:hypothetical protein